MLTPVQADSRRIIVGQVLEVSTGFRRYGEPIDPTLVSIRWRSPSGVVSTLTKESLAHPGAGEFMASVLVDEPGSWVIRVEGAGVVDAVEEIIVVVEPSAL